MMLLQTRTPRAGQSGARAHADAPRILRTAGKHAAKIQPHLFYIPATWKKHLNAWPLRHFMILPRFWNRAAAARVFALGKNVCEGKTVIILHKPVFPKSIRLPATRRADPLFARQGKNTPSIFQPSANRMSNLHPRIPAGRNDTPPRLFLSRLFTWL